MPASVFATAVFLFAASGYVQAAVEREVSFFNIHTKETLTVVYKRDDEYDAAALKKINKHFRDWRTGQMTAIDPELIDIIWQMRQELGSTKPTHLISGYRSHKTNKRLRRRGGGQARKSRHMFGKAADIHFPDVPIKRMRNSALIMERGGVGYYPRSGIPFVHVDTGNVRHWPRLPRTTLARLFPDGHTAHVPRGGRPLNARRVRLASVKKPWRKIGNSYRPAQTITVASLTPDFLPTAKPGLYTASLPGPAAKPQAIARPFAVASLNLDELPLPKPGVPLRTGPLHPLMTASSVSDDERFSSMTHPDQGNLEPLMQRPGQIILASFSRPGPALAVSTFQGPAVVALPTLRLASASGEDWPLRHMQVAWLEE